VTSKERIDLALSFKEADRVAIHDSPWGTTVRRWHEEGLPEGVGPGEYFDFEIVGVGANLSFRYPTETLEDTETYTIVQGADGQRVKNWKHQTSTPEYQDFAVKTRADWEEHKPRLEWSADRIDIEAVRTVEKGAREKGKWFYFSGAFGYDRIQAMIGSERLLMAMAEDPEWVQDIFDTCGKLICTALEEMTGVGIQFDGCFVYDDMGYRNASLFSPGMFRQFEFPNHKRFYDCATSYGLKSILHSCGCVKELIPQLIEAGLTCLQPLEVKAGMDLIELKKLYGDRLAFMGGIDVRKMANPNPTVIEEEIRTKVGFAKQGGGYIYHSDHSVPDNISFEQFKRVVELVHEYGRYG
jgi:uroporphyrinogen decarboxylase